MQNMMKKCALLTKTTTYGALYNEKIETWAHSEYFDAFISVVKGKTAVTNNSETVSSTYLTVKNSIIYTKSSIIALTMKRGITKDNRISLDGVTYAVSFVIEGEGNIYSQLFLNVG